VTVYREELAWAAGIFDGEGYIGTFLRKVPSSGRPIPYISMKVGQCHRPEVIDRLRSALGFGNAYSRQRSGGVIEYIWCANGLMRSQAAVAMLWPWMSAPKREQCARSLTAWHERRKVIGVRELRRRS
jgi:hypothetical protein